MDYSITFARHFSRLVWLLLHESRSVDEQKAALRAIVTVSRDGAVTFATQDYRLVVNGTPLPDALTGVQDLAAQLVGHSVGEIRIQQNASPADLLGFARILASEPVPGDRGAATAHRLRELGTTTLAVTLRTLASPPPPSPVMPTARASGTTPMVPPPRPRHGSGPIRERTSASTRERTSVSSREHTSISKREHTSVSKREHTSVSKRERTSGSRREHASASSRGKQTSSGREHTSARERTSGRVRAPIPERSTGPRPLPAESLAHGIVTDEASGRFLAFAAVQAPKGSTDEAFAKLDATTSTAMATRILNELVTLADNAGRDGLAAIVAAVFAGIARREESATGADRKRAFSMAMRRLSKPTLLRLVAMLLPRHRDRAEDYLTALARAGEDGADALIEQLTAAQSLSDRRVYFDGLVRLNAGVPALMHMLGDARWYVVRNAADLLGELQAREAEGALTDVVRHDDDRVRRAAATALAKLGTPRAHNALREAIRDTSSQVRMQAALGLGQRKEARQAVTLVRALDNESDEDVQLAILSSLGRIATPDAVQKLAKAAEPDGRIFRKKASGFRLAAIQALGEAKTAEAIAALRALAEDKDAEVREAVGALLADIEKSAATTRKSKTAEPRSSSSKRGR